MIAYGSKSTRAAEIRIPPAAQFTLPIHFDFPSNVELNTGTNVKIAFSR